MTNKKDNKLQQLRKELSKRNDLFELSQIANQSSNFDDFLAQLYELTIKDELTGLYNYRHFYILLEKELKRSARYKHEVSLLIIDIDNFKEINDSNGHLAGDMFLKKLAAVLVKTVRKIDSCARYGGDEFAIILPETSIKNAKIMAERLRKKIEQVSIKIAPHEIIKTSISIGVAGFSPHFKTFKEFIKAADSALYSAKKQGKNCVVEYRNP